MPRPYQPSLLRLLHGATALLVPLAWLTGLLVYSASDGRWGRLPLALLFALYALTAGRLRLRRNDARGPRATRISRASPGGRQMARPVSATPTHRRCRSRQP